MTTMHVNDPALPPERQNDPRVRKFSDLADLRIGAKGFLSKEDEQDLLEQGIREFGLSLSESRGILLAIADKHEAPIEREVMKGVAEWMRTAGGRRRRISRHQFNQAVSVYETRANGEISREDARRRVKGLMEENDMKPRRAGFFRSRRWYRRIV